MYEQFRHPEYAAAIDFLQTKMQERKTQILAWATANNVTLTEDRIDRLRRGFIKRMRRQLGSRLKRTSPAVFVELPVASLSLQVPLRFPYSTHDGQRRTLGDYVPYITSVDGTKVIFRCMGRPYTLNTRVITTPLGVQGSTLPVRYSPVTNREITMWKNWLENNGFVWSNAMNYAAYQTLLASANY